MTSLPFISARSGFAAALLVGSLLFITGYEILGSLFMIAGVTLNYILMLSLKRIDVIASHEKFRNQLDETIA
jgi:hypothetical protein